jgi:large subunit ribosomal protein L16
MLQPKKLKYRKIRKGRIKGNASRNTSLSYGDFGIKCLDSCRINPRQIEAARRAITRNMKRQGKVWILAFPDIPVTKKPAEVRMGSGKGSPEYNVFKINPGRIIFEISGIPNITAYSSLKLGIAKLPVKCKIIQRKW